MPRLRILTASALAVAALAPAGASAADIVLHSAPQLRMTDATHAKLNFTTSRKLPRKANGAFHVRIYVAGARVGTIKAAGRHGRDFRYTGILRRTGRLEVGEKYTLRFIAAEQDPMVVKVKLYGKEG